MEPITTLILTISSIGGKLLGVGKLVTGIKLIIAGKKIAGVAVAAKGALIEEAIVHSFNEMTSGDMIINQDPSLIDLSDSSLLSPNLYNDNLITNNTIQGSQTHYDNMLNSTPQITSDHFRGLTFENNEFISDPTHSELLEKIKEVYGQDVNIRSIVRQVEDNFTPIYLSSNISQEFSNFNISDISNIKFPQETLEWIEQSEFEDAQFEYGSELNESNSALSASGEDPLNQSLSTESTLYSYQYYTLNDILDSDEYSTLQKEGIITKKLTIQYEIITKDKEYLLSLSEPEQDICNHLPDFLNEHHLKVDQDKEIFYLLDKKNESKNLVKKIAKTIEECKVELKGKPISEKIYMALSLISLPIVLPGITKSRKEQNVKAEFSNQIIDGNHDNSPPNDAKEKKKETQEDDKIDKLLGVTQFQIRAKISKGKMEEALKLFVVKLPSNHEMYKSFMLLQTRLKRYEKLFNEALISSSEFNAEVQKITMSLLLYIEDYFSEDEW